MALTFTVLLLPMTPVAAKPPGGQDSSQTGVRDAATDSLWKALYDSAQANLRAACIRADAPASLPCAIHWLDNACLQTTLRTADDSTLPRVFITVGTPYQLQGCTAEMALVQRDAARRIDIFVLGYYYMPGGLAFGSACAAAGGTQLDLAPGRYTLRLVFRQAVDVYALAITREAATLQPLGATASQICFPGTVGGSSRRVTD